MLMNKEQVYNFLPHRPPFLFIDSVSKIFLPDCADKDNITNSKDLVGAKVVAHFEVKDDLEILEGHFPGNPILPGVVQIEMMAQTSAFVSLGLTGIDRDKIKVDTLLLGVESSKFRKPIIPGMHLEIHSAMNRSRGLMAYYDCQVFVDGEKMSESKLLARLEIKK